MNAARALLGIHVPGTTLWHRLGVGWKYLVFLALTIPAVFGTPALVLAMLAVTLVLVATTRAPLRLAWGMPWALVILFAFVAGYHLLFGEPAMAIKVVGTTLTALYAGRLILITTPMPVLIDALVTAVRPLRPLGANPERFGLAVAVLVRSIPYVIASFGEVRDAARARGVERNPLASVTPVVVQAVAYARTTGDALMARGLGDDDPDEAPTPRH
ncbi:MAG: energy-coupling factor transporter transmembrane protein EcfT [Propionibacteriaceae bacterium]|nr:energy-coupling factor transporter transmembrane protein EcfT [Propionibacteriaceae bacterium]